MEKSFGLARSTSTTPGWCCSPNACNANLRFRTRARCCKNLSSTLWSLSNWTNNGRTMPKAKKATPPCLASVNSLFVIACLPSTHLSVTIMNLKRAAHWTRRGNDDMSVPSEDSNRTLSSTQAWAPAASKLIHQKWALTRLQALAYKIRARLPDSFARMMS